MTKRDSNNRNLEEKRERDKLALRIKRQNTDFVENELKEHRRREKERRENEPGYKEKRQEQTRLWMYKMRQRNRQITLKQDINSTTSVFTSVITYVTPAAMDVSADSADAIDTCATDTSGDVTDTSMATDTLATDTSLATDALVTDTSLATDTLVTDRSSARDTSLATTLATSLATLDTDATLATDTLATTDATMAASATVTTAVTPTVTPMAPLRAKRAQATTATTTVSRATATAVHARDTTDTSCRRDSEVCSLRRSTRLSTQGSTTLQPSTEGETKATITKRKFAQFFQPKTTKPKRSIPKRTSPGLKMTETVRVTIELINTLVAPKYYGICKHWNPNQYTWCLSKMTEEMCVHSESEGLWNQDVLIPMWSFQEKLKDLEKKRIGDVAYSEKTLTNSNTRDGNRMERKWDPLSFYEQRGLELDAASFIGKENWNPDDAKLRKHV